MKKFVTALIFLLLAGGGVYAYYKYGRTEEKPQVIQAMVSRGAITEVVQATGTLEALLTVQVGSQVSGTVLDLGADYNSIVKKGQVIAQLDPTLLQTQVAVQQANIEKQQTDIDSTKIQLENDQLNLERTQAQYDKNLVSKQVLETADLTVKTRVASIASAEKQMVQLKASLDQAKLNVDYCTIRSPIDGVVVQRQVDKGQTVQASMTTPQFFTLASDLTTLRLTGGVDEADIGKIRPAQDVSFTVDAYPNQVFHGVVDRVRLNATTTSNVVTYQVVANVANADLKLRPSMTATLKIVIETSPDVTRVPNQALRFKATNDMFVALGAQPPQGRGTMNAGNGGASAPSGDQTAQAGRAGSGQSASQTAGQPADAQNRRQGGRGFGGQNGTSTLTPEERQQMAERYGAGGGRGGGGRNGRGRGNAAAANEVVGPVVPLTERNADKIDDLFAPLKRTTTPGTVYVWDETNKTLKRVGVVIGISDGQQSEVVSGDLQPGEQVVTSIILPVTTKPGSNPLMGNQPRGGGPGGQPQPGGAGGGRAGGGGGGGGGRG